MSIKKKPNRSRLFPCGQTRREFVWEMGAGFSGLALTSLLGADSFFAKRALGQVPGAELGRLLSDIRDRQLAGELTTREKALAWAREVLG